VGADRKGPLAAFVVIAVIAAILLVTSVRSQAEPGWLDPSDVPTSVVAAPPVSVLPDWGDLAEGVDQVVEAGTVLVKRATSDPSTTQSDPTAIPTVASPTTLAIRAGSDAGTHRVTQASGDDHATRRHHVVGRHSAPHPSSSSNVSQAAPVRHDHGRHAGWTHAHSHGHAHGRHLGWSRHRH
jgi:hypothetical protein